MNLAFWGVWHKAFYNFQHDNIVTCFFFKEKGLYRITIGTHLAFFNCEKIINKFLWSLRCSTRLLVVCYSQFIIKWIYLTYVHEVLIFFKVDFLLEMWLTESKRRNSILKNFLPISLTQYLSFSFLRNHAFSENETS